MDEELAIEVVKVNKKQQQLAENKAREWVRRRGLLPEEAPLEALFKQLIQAFNDIGFEKSFNVRKSQVPKWSVTYRDMFAVPFDMTVRVDVQLPSGTQREVVPLNYDAWTAGLLKYTLGKNLQMDLTDLVLETAAMDVADHVWLVAVGVGHNSTLKLRPTTSLDDTSSSETMSADFKAYHAQSHYDFVTYLDGFLHYCSANQTSPNEVMESLLEK